MINHIVKVKNIKSPTGFEQCPYCKQDIQILSNVLTKSFYNLGSVLIRTECCGNGLHITPICTWSFEEYKGDRKVDDYDQSIEKYTSNT